MAATIVESFALPACCLIVEAWDVSITWPKLLGELADIYSKKPGQRKALWETDGKGSWGWGGGCPEGVSRGPLIT